MDGRVRSVVGVFARVPTEMQVLTELERRVGREATARAWTSEMFMQYLEQSAYEAGAKLSTARKVVSQRLLEA